jgi:hypothetical protein
MRVAEQKLELRSRRLHSEGTKPQLTQRLLDDDATPADAHGESSESSKGSENGSAREKAGMPKQLEHFHGAFGAKASTAEKGTVKAALTANVSRFTVMTTASCLNLIFKIRKQQKHIIYLPINKLSVHASVHLVSAVQYHPCKAATTRH